MWGFHQVSWVRFWFPETAGWFLFCSFTLFQKLEVAPSCTPPFSCWNSWNVPNGWGCATFVCFYARSWVFRQSCNKPARTDRTRACSMHLSLAFVPQQQPPLVSLVESVGLAATMYRGGSVASLSRSLVTRRRGPFVREQLARSRLGGRTSWSRLFCATTSQQEQLQQQQEEGKYEENCRVDSLESCEPLVHSNPEIQVLLDGYSRLCEEHVPETTEEVFDRNDIRSPLRAVFSNNLVDLSRVQVVGFDYDYTLATCELLCTHHHHQLTPSDVFASYYYSVLYVKYLPTI